MAVSNYYCGTCKNDPSVPCCHMQNDEAPERPSIYDCKCVKLGIKQQGTEQQAQGGPLDFETKESPKR